MSKALIFDFDGVIVLSEQARFHALQQIAQRYDVRIMPAYSKILSAEPLKISLARPYQM